MKEVAETSPSSKQRELACEEQHACTGREDIDGGHLWKLPVICRMNQNFSAEKDLKDPLIQLSHFYEEKKNN